jgi:hypothetical protein
VVIVGYFIGGYWWLYILLVTIGLLAIIGYSIDAYSFGAYCIDDYWLFFYWFILMIIGHYYSVGY